MVRAALAAEVEAADVDAARRLAAAAFVEVDAAAAVTLDADVVVSAMSDEVAREERSALVEAALVDAAEVVAAAVVVEEEVEPADVAESSKPIFILRGTMLCERPPYGRLKASTLLLPSGAVDLTHRT